MVIFELINSAMIGVKFITVNHHFSFSTFQRQKKSPELRLLSCNLVNRAPSDQNNSSQPKLWTPGPKSRIYSSNFVDGEPTAENPHPTLNLGYPNFEKRVQAILGKKRKTRTLLMVYLPYKIYPNRVRMKTF